MRGVTPAVWRSVFVGGDCKQCLNMRRDGLTVPADCAIVEKHGCRTAATERNDWCGNLEARAVAPAVCRAGGRSADGQPAAALVPAESRMGDGGLLPAQRGQQDDVRDAARPRRRDASGSAGSALSPVQPAAVCGVLCHLWQGEPCPADGGEFSGGDGGAGEHLRSAHSH